MIAIKYFLEMMKKEEDNTQLFRIELENNKLTLELIWFFTRTTQDEVQITSAVPTQEQLILHENSWFYTKTADSTQTQLILHKFSWFSSSSTDLSQVTKILDWT